MQDAKRLAVGNPVDPLLPEVKLESLDNDPGAVVENSTDINIIAIDLEQGLQQLYPLAAITGFATGSGKSRRGTGEVPHPGVRQRAPRKSGPA